MEARAYQIHLQFPPQSIFDNKHVRTTKELKVYAKRNTENGNPSVAANKVQRRAILQLLGVNFIFGKVVVAAPMQDMKEPDMLRTLKTASGVRIQDIVDGQGQEAHEGDTVEFNYVCRRSNGYFVYSTVDQFSGESSPVILPLDDEQIIRGLKEVLIGMKVGGKRKALIPPSVGFISDTLQPIPEEFGPRRSLLSHAKEPLVFEVQLLKVL
ncbi:hypothetical protein CASFOL_024625 [Castilleja foliolosa]|uniref:peptidylprolyl isomerase n=1 Tax=Castilleja foliolosa TaxID=1961234 RepID=A0ABD3CNU9_9LAMI